MSKSIKRVLRDSVLASLTASIGDYAYGVQLIAAFDGQVLESSHIRVATPLATPQRAGETNLGIWDCTVAISAVTSIDAANNDDHDNLAGLIEAYCLQGNKTIAASLTNAELRVNNVFVGNAMEMAIGMMRHSSQELQIECMLK